MPELVLDLAVGDQPADAAQPSGIDVAFAEITADGGVELGEKRDGPAEGLQLQRRFKREDAAVAHAAQEERAFRPDPQHVGDEDGGHVRHRGQQRLASQ